MSPGVVDVLQVIDVDEDHEDVTLHAHRELECLLGESDEGATIWKPSKLVDEQQRLEIILGALLCRDVVVHRVDPTRLVGHSERRRRDRYPYGVTVLEASQRFDSQR